MARRLIAVLIVSWLGLSAAAHAQTLPPPVKETPPPVKETPPPVNETPPSVNETPPPVKETVPPPLAKLPAPPAPAVGKPPAPPEPGVGKAPPKDAHQGSAPPKDAHQGSTPPKDAHLAPLPPFPGQPGPHGHGEPDVCCPPDPQPPTVTCWHIGFEYLLWFTNKDNLPPLATNGSFQDARPAALDRPSTRVLLGGNQLEDDRHHGVRFTFGVGVDNSIDWSFLASFFILERTTTERLFTSTGGNATPVLARPFFNVTRGLEDSDPIAIPNIAAGAINFSYDRRLYGGDANFRYVYIDDGSHHIYFLLGGRALWLDESLHVDMISQDLPGIGVPGNSYFLRESFSVSSRFYGGQVGLEYEFRVGPVSIAAAGKFAIGGVDLVQENRAFTRIVEPNGIVTSSADRALYVSPNNAGTFRRTTFAWIPEGTLKVGFDFNEYVRLSVGYTGFYLSEALRVGRSIDRFVNVQPVGTTAVFTPAASPPRLDSSAFWAQGLDVSLRFSF
jgi:hypothetical protein